MPQINPAPLAGADPVRAPPRRDSVRQSVRQSVTQSIHQASLNLVDDEAAELLPNKGKERNETPTIPLSDEPIHNLTHITWTNSFAILSAIPAMGLIYLANILCKYLSEAHKVSFTYVVANIGVVANEIVNFILLGLKSKAYRDKHFYCQWPSWVLLVTGTIGAAAFLNDGDMGYFAIPLSWLGHSTSMFVTRFYRIYKGGEVVESALKDLRGSLLTSFVVIFINLAPIFGQLIPVNFVAEKYPLTNTAVTGFGFPAFTFACRKYALSLVMKILEGKVKKGELPVSQLLPIYATWSHS